MIYNDELNSRNGVTNMDKKLEARIARLEKLLSKKSVKNETKDVSKAEILKAMNTIWDNIKFLSSDKVAIDYLGMAGEDPENDYDDYMSRIGEITMNLEMARDMLGLYDDIYFD